MLAIKLRPVGKKKQITYRVVVMEKKSKLKGKFIEDLGWYNPHTNQFSVKSDRAKYWMQNGAQPTDTVHNILVKGKVQEAPKIAKHKVPPKKEEPQAQAGAASEPKKEATEEASAQAQASAGTEAEPQAPAEEKGEEKKEETKEEAPQPQQENSEETKEEKKEESAEGK